MAKSGKKGKNKKDKNKNAPAKVQPPTILEEREDGTLSCVKIIFIFR